MRYRIVLEYDRETRSYTATVPGLPIVVDASSEKEAVKLAKEAIAWYRGEAGASKSARPEPPVQTVDPSLTKAPANSGARDGRNEPNDSGERTEQGLSTHR